MPIDYKLYPKDWHALSRRIRFERAGSQCEWCGARHGEAHPVTGSKVVLTVAHLGIDKPDGSQGDKRDLHDVRENNLAALCQRCHLNFDREDHWQARWANARAARLANGEQLLFAEAFERNGDDEPQRTSSAQNDATTQSPRRRRALVNRPREIPALVSNVERAA